MDPERWERRARRWERKMDRWGDRWGEDFGERMDRWDWRYRRRHSPGKHLFSGLIFVAIGVVFLLGNMGMLNVDYVLRFWPVILIALGIFKLVEAGDDYGHSSGIFWIVVGGLFLTGSLGLLRVAFRDFWPVILIGFGSLMLWRSTLARREFRSSRSNTEPPRDSADKEPRAAATEEAERETAASSNSILSATAILGSVERKNNSQDFRGGSATSVMGGCEIDLRGASITAPHEPVLEVFAMWGGIEIRVPPDWTVVSQVDPILGGYEDSTQQPKEATKRFVIRGTVLMGGIEVTN